MKLISALVIVLLGLSPRCGLAELNAGIARIDITDRTGPVNDPCFAKALVLKKGATTAVLITVDAVAVDEIGRLGKGFLASVRGSLEQKFSIAPSNVIINASHCHGVIRADSAQLVVQSVKEAIANMVPVNVGAGSGMENRISENRRLKMKDGSEVDMRRAYAMPRDEDVAGVGPMDPPIGILRVDRIDGRPLAVLYNFACHPIMNPPSKGSSADYPGYASKVIEEALGGGALAFFVQGCGGDINPVRYKEVSRPADAEPLGTMLGASVLSAVRLIETKAEQVLKVTNHVITLPRGKDYERRIANIEAEQKKLLVELKPTNINFKAFLPLLLQHRLFPQFPSHHAQGYLHDRAREQKAICQLDADNLISVESYLADLEVLEQLTRLNTNLALLKKHHAETAAAINPTISAEVCGFRVGDFRLVTFPGELSVQVGLNLKAAVQIPNAFIAGYTNGYLYYTPTVEQRSNLGYAQEDCDNSVAPEWQAIFEAKALDVLKQLQ